VYYAVGEADKSKAGAVVAFLLSTLHLCLRLTPGERFLERFMIP